MKYSHILFVLGTLLFAAEGSRLDGVLNRWRRQVHCQPDDEACQRCSSSCGSVGTSHLPECCEAYNACCDEYFQACKQCSNVVSHDRYFPEYCCASFTDCCDLITTFTTQVKPPAAVRSSKPSPDLKIPEVAAPKPSSFPAGKSVIPPAELEYLSLRQNGFRESDFQQNQSFLPQDSIFAPKTPAIRTQEPAFETRPSGTRQRRPSAFAAEIEVGAGPESEDVSQRQITRTQARAQVRPQSRAKEQSTRRPQVQDDLDVSARRGRVTSRGRVSA